MNGPQGWYDRSVERWVHFSKCRPTVPLLIGIALTAVALPFAVQLRISTSIKKLLPEDMPAVQAADRASLKVGDIGYFSIIVEHEKQDRSIHYLESFAKELEKTGFVRMAVYENPVDFLNKNFFLLVPLEDLRKVHRELEKKRRAANPFALDLEEDEAKDSASDKKNPQLEQAKETYTTIQEMPPYHVSKDGKTAVMTVRLRESLNNLSFVRRVYRELLKMSAQHKEQGAYPQDMQVHVAGSLKSKIGEYELVLSDTKNSAIYSGILILIILLTFFRNPLPVGVIFVPLVLGLIWAFAMTWAAIGFLNVITAPLFMVLLGLGIDHGIHLLKRYRNERALGADPDQAMTTTLCHTGRATLISALTTTGGFYLLLATDFRGFSHLGFISGTAMLMVIVAYFLVLPAIVFHAERISWFNATLVQGPKIGLWSKGLKSVAQRPAILGFVGAVFLLGLGAYSAAQLEFNYDFTKLTGKVKTSRELLAKQKKVHKESLTPGAVVFAPDQDTLGKLVQGLKDRRDNDQVFPTIGRIMSIQDFYPPDQEARLAEIREMAPLVTAAVLRKTKDPVIKDMLRHLKKSSSLSPIAWEEVPSFVREYFEPQDGSADQAVFIFPSVQRKRYALEFDEDMTPIAIEGKVYRPAGHTLVMAAMLRVVVEQGLTIFALSLLAIAIILVLQFRSPKPAGHTLLALFMGLGLMCILLWLLEVDINFYNMAIFAAVVGMGIDVSIHLFSHWRTQSEAMDARARVEKTLLEVGGPVSISTLTTIAGYVGMLASFHRGIRSIGQLAVVGLSSCLLAAMLVFPLYLVWLKISATSKLSKEERALSKETRS